MSSMQLTRMRMVNYKEALELGMITLVKSQESMASVKHCYTDFGRAGG